WEVYPPGLGQILRFIVSRTGELPLYVTENGAAYALDEQDSTRDPARVSYLHRHLHQALDAIEAGIPLRGYFAWSLLDNFEWARGYEPRFGIVHVDYATQERRVRDSGRFLARVVREGVPPLDGGAQPEGSASPS
ncbi:MAG TPA: family 1 glycosylhydrolase, partial [Candidatus Limnocylindrales bacterium]